MTRPTKRDIRRELEGLEIDTGLSDAPTVILPDGAMPNDQLEQDGPEIDSVRKTTGGDDIGLQVPHHRPVQVFGSGVPVLTECEVAPLWDAMPDDARAAEREQREKHDDPIPAVLEVDA